MIKGNQKQNHQPYITLSDGDWGKWWYLLDAQFENIPA